MRSIKLYKQFNESNTAQIRQEFEDIFIEYGDKIRLAYQEQDDIIVCYIFPLGVNYISIMDIEDLVLHFILFMNSDDNELFSLSILFYRKWQNYYNEEPNRFGIHHPYFKTKDARHLFDIQDLNKDRSFESIELKFRKI